MAGSDTAIGADQLFRAHAAYVRSFLHKLGVSNLWVDDAVQDVFIVAHTCNGYHPGPASPKTWLGAIAIRVAANARRKQYRLSKVMLTYDDAATLLENQAAEAPATHIAHVLPSLCDQDRDVFFRFYVQNEDCPSIAEALGVPIGTIYRRLHTARKRFAELLA